MADMKFEEALKRLESIVDGLEQGKISLEDSLKKYEEGIKLAKFCSDRLEDAEKKIEIITKDSSGKTKRKSFKAKENAKKRMTEEINNSDAEEGFLF